MSHRRSLPALLLAALLSGCGVLPIGGGLPDDARGELERATAALGRTPDESARDRFVARVLAQSERLERAGRLAAVAARCDAVVARVDDLVDPRAERVDPGSSAWPGRLPDGRLPAAGPRGAPHGASARA